MICSSGITFDPQVGGRRLTFGFHGIFQGTAVLYDHQTSSLWMHLTGECIEGELAGTFLKRVPAGRHTTWADWRAAHPTTDVLMPDPRYENRSGDRGYFPELASRRGGRFLPRFFAETIQTRDERLAPHDLVYGIVVGERPRAYPFATLAAQPVVEETLHGVPVAVWFDARSGSAAAFDRRVGARTLTFRAAGEGRRQDTGTGSLWTMDGVCVRGPLKASRLKPVFGLQAEWYGWAANHPDTTLWSP